MGESLDMLVFALRFVLILPAIILHEMAHGYAALWCGDDTAKRAGRLSANPIVHVDLWGTIIMPAIMLLASGGRFAFGYAKPVPINPYNFKDERRGMLITGIAGPLTNLGLAIIAGSLVRSLSLFTIEPSSILGVIKYMLVFFCQINLWLMFFNLIPIPPLDGSRVIQRFLPDSLRDAYHGIERYGFFIIIGIIFLLPGLFGAYYSLTVLPIARILTGMPM